MKPRDPLVSRRRACAARAAVAAAVCALSIGCHAASPSEGAPRTTEQAIVGGEPGQHKAYPWMVALFQLYKSKPYFLCGGTLIDSTHVLTAGHCSLMTWIDHQQHHFVDEPVDPAQVVVARRPQSLAAVQDDDLIEVSSVVVHPQYDDVTTDYDVAVWKLAKPVKLREYPRLMTNPAVMDWLSQLHLPARVIGYGARSEDDEEGSDALLQVDIPLISRAQCRDKYAALDPAFPAEEAISDRMICAGTRTGGKGACYGDSGGPLLLPASGKSPLLVGVVSWGIDCDDSDYPGVYANVAALTDYIGACQADACETLAPQRTCDWSWVDCDGQPENGCEKAPATAMACGIGCDAPACGDAEACLIGEDFRCAPAKPVTPIARCVFKEQDEYGTYLAWFSVNNENVGGSIQIPFSDHSVSEGEPLLTPDVIPAGLIEYAALVALDRPDSGTYSLRGPDGQRRSASVTADTPECPLQVETDEQELTSLSKEPGRRLHQAARARLQGVSANASLVQVSRP